MGADLYIRSITNAASAKFDKLFKAACAERRQLSEAGDIAGADTKQVEVDEYYDKLLPEEGYFRDSYNATSLFQSMNMSWWLDLNEMLDDDGNLQPIRAEELLLMVSQAEIIKRSAKELKKAGGEVDEGDNSPDEWHKFFVQKKQRFIEFLERAIEMKEAIYCSV